MHHQPNARPIDPKVRRILAAARADAIPQDKRGLWFTLKVTLDHDQMAPRDKDWTGKEKWTRVPAGHYTQLWRLTMENAHLRIPGELVMCDMPDELYSHMQFMLQAHGDVLISGLGLGCVARGCLANPRVRSVTVLESDRAVLQLVAPHMVRAERADRLKIVPVDALSYADVLRSQPLVKTFDCAWHDLWSDPDDEKSRHLQLMHSHMIALMAHRVRDFQGAWRLPRNFRIAVNRHHSQRGRRRRIL